MPCRAKSLQLCPTLCNSGLYPARHLSPWDSPGKNTGEGCQSPPAENLPDTGIEPVSPAAPAL